MAAIDIHLERGSKRAIVGAAAWPGWIGIARDAESALRALAGCGVRYGRVVHAAHLRFKAPADASAFNAVERLRGGSTTDFGAPKAVPSIDKQAFAAAELRRERGRQFSFSSLDSDLTHRYAV